MDIHQLSVSYVQEHDRLLLRVNARSGEELRLWLTRRLMHGLMPALRKALGDLAARMPHSPGQSTNPAALVLPDDSARRLMADFQHQAAVGAADFQTPFQSQPSALPLGPEPMLVTEVTLTIPHTGQARIGFKEAVPGGTPRSLNIALEPQLMHALVHLLGQGLSTAQWFDAAGAAPEPAPEHAAPGERPRYVN